MIQNMFTLTVRYVKIIVKFVLPPNINCLVYRQHQVFQRMNGNESQCFDLCGCSYQVLMVMGILDILCIVDNQSRVAPEQLYQSSTIVVLNHLLWNCFKKKKQFLKLN